MAAEHGKRSKRGLLYGGDLLAEAYDCWDRLAADFGARGDSLSGDFFVAVGKANSFIADRLGSADISYMSVGTRRLLISIVDAHLWSGRAVTCIERFDWDEAEQSFCEAMEAING